MRYCKINDCTDAKNNCKECQYRDQCDYVWVSDIWKRNADLLTPLMPGWVKPEFTNNHIVTITGQFDFCIFNNPKKSDSITIQDICVDESGRGQGLSNKLLYGLMEKFDKDIIAKCVKGTSADSFWSHKGIKIGEEPSKQRTLSVYKVTNPNKKSYKIDLFE